MTESNRRQFIKSASVLLAGFPAIAANSKNEANRLLHRQYRAGYVVPEKV